MAERDSIIIPVTLMVSGGSGGGGGASNKDADVIAGNEEDAKQKEVAALAEQRKNIAKAFAVNTAKKAVNLAFQGYGDMTGDYVTGNNIQTIVNEVSSTVTGAIGSFAAGGWYGLAFWAAGEAIDTGIQVYQYHSNLKKSEAQAKFNQKRVYGTVQKS